MARLSWSLLLGFLALPAVYGQATDAAISGAVRDISGAVIAGAKLEAVNTQTGVTTRVVANPQGG